MEGVVEILFAVGCRFGQTCRYELIVRQFSIVIDVHEHDELPDLLVGGTLLFVHVLCQFLNSQIPIFILINFQKDLAEHHDVFLGELRCDVVQC